MNKSIVLMLGLAGSGCVLVAAALLIFIIVKNKSPEPSPKPPPKPATLATLTDIVKYASRTSSMSDIVNYIASKKITAIDQNVFNQAVNTLPTYPEKVTLAFRLAFITGVAGNQNTNNQGVKLIGNAAKKIPFKPPPDMTSTNNPPQNVMQVASIYTPPTECCTDNKPCCTQGILGTKWDPDVNNFIRNRRYTWTWKESVSTPDTCELRFTTFDGNAIIQLYQEEANRTKGGVVDTRAKSNFKCPSGTWDPETARWITAG